MLEPRLNEDSSIIPPFFKRDAFNSTSFRKIEPVFVLTLKAIKDDVICSPTLAQEHL